MANKTGQSFDHDIYFSTALHDFKFLNIIWLIDVDEKVFSKWKMFAEGRFHTQTLRDLGLIYRSAYAQ